MFHSAKDLGDRKVELSGGQIIHNFHASDSCLGEYCPVHKPSNHAHREAKLYFNGAHMYRVLNDGILIVDPDDYRFNETGHAILRNSAKCLNCDDEIESSSRHDFKECKCQHIFVDGGFDYVRHGFENKDNYESTSVIVNDERIVH